MKTLSYTKLLSTLINETSYEKQDLIIKRVIEIDMSIETRLRVLFILLENVCMKLKVEYYWWYVCEARKCKSRDVDNLVFCLYEGMDIGVRGGVDIGKGENVGVEKSVDKGVDVGVEKSVDMGMNVNMGENVGVEKSVDMGENVNMRVDVGLNICERMNLRESACSEERMKLDLYEDSTEEEMRYLNV
ncbi:hypothetical protein NAPIS_ORF02538 [Vairimorpha apis BRL 01]|uniref:Uncharacterized protein n=1 Tax=Vairimorpha apis BRL 01 TaxID=1037528 RepID=T0KWS6_9MICR|nr:hypothetical protein NAPIS_ORF02538 [Vairimorpha apis BRL 01]